MKKILSIILSLFLIVLLTGCGASTDSEETTVVDNFGVYVEIPDYLEFNEDVSDDNSIFYDFVDNEQTKERFALMDSGSGFSAKGDLEDFSEGVVEGYSDAHFYNYDKGTFDVPVKCASFYHDDIGMYTFVNNFLIGDRIVSLFYSSIDRDDCERIFDKINETVFIENEDSAGDDLDDTSSDDDLDYSSEDDSSEPEPTIGELNALSKALDYLDYDGFSKTGLIKQLEFEGFTDSEIDYAIENVSVDWKEEAVEKAGLYLESSSFSKEALIEQLEFEGFTHDQAQYGANQVYK